MKRVEAVGYHHITRTGGAALVRRLQAGTPARPWRVMDLDALAPGVGATRVAGDAKIFFHSHNAFGVHKLVDWDVSYLTVLRDPVAHIVSEFFWATGLEVEDLSSGQLVERFAAYLASFDNLNHQAFELAVSAELRPARNAHPTPQNLTGSGEQFLLPALRNIETLFEFVGQTEDPGPTNDYLRTRFGFGDVTPDADGFRNASFASTDRGRSFKANLPASILDELAEKTRIDRFLYDKAGRLTRPAAAAVLTADALPADWASYRLKLNVPWIASVETLMTIGARARSGTAGPGQAREWRLSFTLPVPTPAAGAINVVVRLNSGSTAGCDEAIELDVRIGSRHQTLVIAQHDLLDDMISINQQLDSDELSDGALAFAIVGRPVGGGTHAPNYFANPLPHLIQSISLSEMPRYGLGADLLFGTGRPGEAAICDGFMTGHAADFNWTSKEWASLTVTLDELSVLTLERAREATGRAMAVLELDAAPFFVQDKLWGQRFGIVMPGQEPMIAELPGPSRRRIACLVDLAPSLATSIVKIDLHLFQAKALAEVMVHSDRINRLGIMLFAIRLMPVVLSPSYDCGTAQPDAAADALRTCAIPHPRKAGTGVLA